MALKPLVVTLLGWMKRRFQETSYAPVDQRKNTRLVVDLSQGGPRLRSWLTSQWRPERVERSGNRAIREYLLNPRYTLDLTEGHLTWEHFAYDLSIISCMGHTSDLILTCFQYAYNCLTTTYAGSLWKMNLSARSDARSLFS